MVKEEIEPIKEKNSNNSITTTMIMAITIIATMATFFLMGFSFLGHFQVYSKIERMVLRVPISLPHALRHYHDSPPCAIFVTLMNLH